MVAMNITLLLPLLLSSAWLSMAKPYINEDGNAKDEISVTLNAKVPIEMTRSDQNSKIGGRKMGLHNVTRSEANKVKAGQVGVSSDGSYKSKLSSSSQQVSQGKYKTSSVGRVVEETDDGGFVAFSADYRAPRHHPPKNN